MSESSKLSTCTFIYKHVLTHLNAFRQYNQTCTTEFWIEKSHISYTLPNLYFAFTNSILVSLHHYGNAQIYTGWVEGVSIGSSCIYVLKTGKRENCFKTILESYTHTYFYNVSDMYP